ncbi:Interferon- developmental regulator 1, partial [Coemansia aciculifera]
MSTGSTNELLRAALNASSGGRVTSSSGRSSSGTKSSRKATPKSPRSVTASRDVSDDEQAFDDTASIASDDTWVINGNDDSSASSPTTEDFSNDGGCDNSSLVTVDNWEELLQSGLDALGEKRVATRERGLATVARVMANVYVGEALEGRKLASLELLKRCARTSKSELEGMLALRGIALWFINFGVDAGPEYADARVYLKALARDH